MSKIKKYTNLENLQIFPINVLINFSNIKKIKFLAHDILRCEVTGEVSERHIFNKINIVQCSMYFLDANSADFSGTDFKDSTLRNCVFNETNMHATHINTCNLYNVNFVNTNITWTNLNQSNFYSCQFIKCDFTDLLIKGCKFYDCYFESCQTTNKVFESCLLLNCNFKNLEIQYDTIIDNFGLTSKNLNHCLVRSGSPRLKHKKYEPSKLPKSMKKNLTSIERFKFEYFTQQMENNTYNQLNETFKIEDWIKLCKVPASFITLFSDLSDFLLYLYREDKIIIHPLLKLHDLNYRISSNLDLEKYNEIYKSLMGIQMYNARLFEAFLVLVSDLTKLTEKELVLLVSGPLDKDFFLTNLNIIFQHKQVELKKLIPHNSPLEMFLQFGSTQSVIVTISILLSSRFKFELKRIEKQLKAEKTKMKSFLTTNGNAEIAEVNQKQIQNINSLLTFHVGGGKDKLSLLELRFSAMMPGSLLADLSLDVNLDKIKKIKEIIVDILINRGKS